jgi:CheY-like chemotaxis protein
MLEDLTGKKILVVDDEDYIRIHLKNLLERLGANVIEAGDGEMAVRKSEELPNAILMDVKMPILNGIEATKKIRENSKTEKIPIIMLSAKAQEKEIKEGLDSGANDYLTKPSTFNQILEILKKYI